VVSACSGEEALTVLAERGAPDIAVLDVMMPGMTGLELLRLLQATPEYASLPAVFLSGRVEPADIAAGRALGATYLTKPIVVTALNSAIDRVLEPAPTGTW
jgi:CheY-like chemotaxis protein